MNELRFPSIPTISEDEARDALLSEVEKHCCYGKKAARDLVFLNITPSSAFHVGATIAIYYCMSKMSLAYPIIDRTSNDTYMYMSCILCVASL